MEWNQLIQLIQSMEMNNNQWENQYQSSTNDKAMEMVDDDNEKQQEKTLDFFG